MTLGPEQGFRCSAASRLREECAWGTASTVRRFLLVECAGPWGTDAVTDSRLPEEVKVWLGDLEQSHGVRPLLVRRPGRAAAPTSRVFLAYAGADGPWLRSRVLDDVRQLPEVGTEALVDVHPPPGWEAPDEPVLAVCTHGRHDACCAERGRPFVAALAEVDAAATWEVSHLGGDRFAANVLVLPDGLYYGGLQPEDARAFVQAHAEGRLDLDHLRGRTAYPFAVQAAEAHLRRQLGEDRDRALRLVDRHRDGAVTTAVFEQTQESARPGTTQRRWTVRMSTTRGEERQLTCRAQAAGRPPVHRLLGIDPSPPSPAARS